jgi:hypothetical protein
LDEFVTARFPEATMPRTTGKADMLERIREIIRDGEQARIRKAGEEFGPWRKQVDALERIREIVGRLGVGPKLIVQRERDREMLSVRELASLPDLGAAPALEDIHYAVWGVAEVRSGGLWLCRFIDGTRSVSKHGYLSGDWQGAAEDIFVTEGGMGELVDVAEFIVNQTKAGRLKAATVIVDQDIWTPGSGWRVYGGHWHGHVHVDVAGGGPCKP